MPVAFHFFSLLFLLAFFSSLFCDSNWLIQTEKILRVDNNDISTLFSRRSSFYLTAYPHTHTHTHTRARAHTEHTRAHPYTHTYTQANSDAITTDSGLWVHSNDWSAESTDIITITASSWFMGWKGQSGSSLVHHVTNSLFMPSVTDDSKVLTGFHLKELRVTGCEVQWQTIPKTGHQRRPCYAGPL